MSNNVTILYVDDEFNNLFIFQKMFEKKYNVLTAQSGSEGLEKLSSYADDIIVVISDMRMPLMNGVEFVKKAKEKYLNIAYFILTGFDFNEEIDSALKEDVIQQFFTKPLDMQEIDGAIQKILHKLS